MKSLWDGPDCKPPIWLIVLAVLLAVFYIFLETGHVVARDWDQDTLLYSYNNAFYQMFLRSGEFPQWNPYIQSGISQHANLPFPLSFSNIMTFMTGDGVKGFFSSRLILLVIGVYFLLGILKILGIRNLSCLVALFLFFEYQLCHSSHEELPMLAAIVLIYSCLKYAEEKHFYVIGFAAIFLGVVLNDYACHATLAIFPLQLLLVFFLRKDINWKRYLYAMALIWMFGVILGLPTILPQLVDVKQSAKIATLQAGGRTLSFKSFLFFMDEAFFMRFSRAMILAVTLGVGTLPVFWKSMNELARAFIKAAGVFTLCLILFFFFKRNLEFLPMVGKIFVAFEPMRLTVLVHFGFLICFALAVDRLIYADEDHMRKGWRFLFLLAIFVLAFLSSNYANLASGQYAKLLSKPNILTCLTLIPFLVALLIRRPFFKFGSLIVMLGVFILLWGMTGSRYYTMSFPSDKNPFRPLKQSQISIFPNEHPASEKEMTAFLQKQTADNFVETAELRDNPIGYDIFQRYPNLRIATIHGFSNIRPMRMHRLYLWLLNDLSMKDPEKYNFLYQTGGFAGNYGTSYDTELLNLMGVRYLIAGRSYKDERFHPVLKGKENVILEDRDAFPRAFLVPRVYPIAVLEEMEDYLKNASTKDLRMRAPVLEADLGGKEVARKKLGGLLYTGEDAEVPGDVKIESFSPNKVSLLAQAEKPGLLVLTQSFHHGWTARVNGRKSPEIYPAYYAFMGVKVPAGESTVQFEFNDQLFMKTLKVAFLLIGFLVLMITVSIIRSYNNVIVNDLIVIGSDSDDKKEV